MGSQHRVFCVVAIALLVAFGIWGTLPSTPAASAEEFQALSVPSTGPLPGQIIIDPDHPQWLMRKGGQHVYVCGPGDPEDFLYLGTRNADGTRDGDQVQRIQKLIKYGGNCIYMQVVRTHGGDAKLDTTHNPFVNSEPNQGLDEDILNQWEDWVTLMDRNDILIYLFLYDDGARIWNTGDRVGPEEKAFVEAIVQRFKHHKNLVWNVGEESEERYSAARVQAIAEVIQQTDDHNHLIGNHHLSGTTFKAWQPEGAINHYSMQLNSSGEEAHQGAIATLNEAAGRYQVIYSESTAAPTDIEGARHHAWAVAMGGLMPMFLSMDIASTPAESLQQCRFLQQFFEGTDFYSMFPHDELSEAETKYVLANPGRSYIVYADQLQHTIGLKDVPAGRCLISWLDCQTGRTATGKTLCEQPGQATFKKPVGFGSECAAWIRFPDARPTNAVARHKTVQPTSTTPASMNMPPAVSDFTITVRGESKTFFHLQLSDSDGPGPYTYTIVSGPKHGKLEGKNNDRSIRQIQLFVVPTISLGRFTMV